METRVYLLEDDKDICELIDCAFSLGGIPFSYYRSVCDFEKAVAENTPDLVLLDIMLGDGNGLEEMKSLKERFPDVYCIMLSALGSETDKVKGLNMGADDYISKPFGVMELTAKVKAVIRRIKKEDKTIAVNGLTLDEDKLSAKLGENELEINATEFKLLKLLTENNGRVLTRERILTYLWGDAGESRTLDNYINHLRKQGIEGIETIFGIGYKFNPK